MQAIGLGADPYGNSYYATVNNVRVNYAEADEDNGQATIQCIKPDDTPDYIETEDGLLVAGVRYTVVKGTVKLYESGNPLPPGGDSRPPIPADVLPFNYANYQSLLSSGGTGIFIPPQVAPSTLPG